MTKPEEKGSRDTGSDEPSAGTDRPSGAYEGDESVPQYGEEGKPDFQTGFTQDPPRDVEPEVPPYEGRKTSADSGETTEKEGARTGGATAPTTDPHSKGQTAGGSTTSPAQEQPAAGSGGPDRDDDMVGPAHTPGTGRAEDKR
ncbi:hypothetical protein A5724_11450 [Mycobacterium sp. ACS1612]|uniref:hypothetical protein n=1 Tax=Mycobacterium sp. ACS1612 TaxID=1834117 RepID=UPI0007FCAC40|nr:hypothetical protein [Mycobacterium sp. ACS1612]OBF37772.1 hypothetical protein A5724_11450 [Mycobacterium sp. ACS1612]